MHLSEFNRKSKGKLESNQQRPIQPSSDLSPQGNHNQLVELVWENGKIMMQGQSNKNKKTNATTSRKFTAIDSLFNDFGGSSEPGLTQQDDELLRWLNYTADDNPQAEYVPDFLPELSGVTTKDPCTSNNFTLIDKAAHLHPTVRDSASFGSGISDLFSTSHQIQSNKGHNSNSGVVNFSHFSRPAANVRANLENIVGLPNPVCSSGFAIPPQNHNHICQKSDNMMRQVKAGESEKKAVEPMIASSSVCSANSVERVSNDPSNSSKRKSRNSEDSEWQSEDIDDESVGVKKARGRGGTSSKRSRAAEVHNLSERRRRDRINEKMRSLQELIPNCSKGDKASMLDEAIEYLKTLQLQVQIMSMGAGYYMPRMMLPNGMQHINPTPHFSMGYGFGIQAPHFHRPLIPHFPPTHTQVQPVSGSMSVAAQPPINSTTGVQVVTENGSFNSIFKQ